MDVFTFHGTVLDECPQCGGIWFDEGELKRCQAAGSFAYLEMEAAAHPSVLPVDTSESGRTCPNCDTRLSSYNYLYTSEIELDECDDCFGVWVQDGELQKMADFLASERSRESSPAIEDAKVRAKAAELVAALESQSAESRIRTGRIVTLWQALGRRPMPFSHSRR